MKFLVAIVLLALAVAEAHHTPQHTLSGPRFQPEKVYRYDVEFNVTSGVLGLSSQVSKAALKAEVSIYAKNEKEHILKIENVYTSGSLEAVESKEEYIRMQKNSDLEGRLSIPIQFTLENGEVTRYSLSPRESLESKKIKKSILRSLEMQVPESALNKMESDSEQMVPFTYTVTKDTDFGVHTTNYMITVSPYSEFPAHMDVYNITRIDNFEDESYPAHHMHHNFQSQGCSELCNKENDAECPAGQDPEKTSPIQMSFTQQHHLSLHEGIMNPEIIQTVERHVAQMYDQDMEVLLMCELRRKNVLKATLVEPSGQQTYTDLKDMEAEINDKEIDESCQYKSTDEYVASAKKLLSEISRIIVSGDLEDRQSTIIGQKIILLKNALKKLSVSDLEKVKQSIQDPSHLQEAEQKVKRQIFLDILPLIGTEECVTYITQYIKNNLDNNGVLVWEAKEMLEALPENIQRPTERNIRELRSLTQESKEKLRNNHLLHSASHITLGRVLGSMCESPEDPKSQQAPKSSWFTYPQSLRSSSSSSSHSQYEPVKCPEGLAREIVQEISEKLRRSQKKEDIAVYLETLSNIGTPDVLPVIAKYVYGTAENVQQSSRQITPSYVDFVKTNALYTLHNALDDLSEEVLQIVLPVFFNETETPKVRNAAFSVLIRCQPSLGILQSIATQSWGEPSNEVGSYVTSTLETFGNSSLPCMQQIASRIQKILPQLNRFDIGVHHSKNLLWSYFDDQRNLGLEGRFEYTPSNESIVPSTFYKSLSYSTDSLRDVLMQMAMNIQGLTSEKMMKTIESFIQLRPVNSFDSQREKEIFEEATLNSRIPDGLRYTFFKRIFYTSSFNYFDSESPASYIKTLESFFEYIRAYLKVSSAEYDGYLVKLYMPSTYHTKTIARTLPYPVEFEMSQPLVFAIKAKSLERSPTPRNFHFYIRPSVYFTKLYTNQLKNIGDCKEVGVYHEHKLAMSYPFELKLEGINFPNLTIKYKVPELQKKVFTFLSEAGTYAGKKELETLPSYSHRVPIRTQPTPFKMEKNVNIVAVPPVYLEVHHEDIDFNTERLPRDPIEALDIVVRRALNAGWRYRSMNLSLQENSKIWPRNTEVTFSIRYHHDHITKYFNQPHSAQMHMSEQESNQKNVQWSSDYQWQSQQDESQSQWSTEEPTLNHPQSQWLTEDYQSQWATEESQWNKQDSEQSWMNSQEQDWSKDMKPNDIPSNKNPETYIEQGRKAALKLISGPHIKHVLNIEIEAKPLRTTAYLKMEYNHTYCRSAHSVRIDAAAKPSRDPRTYEVTIDHIMAFMNKHSEFRYDTHKERQQAVFITALGLPHGSAYRPWEKAETVFKGVFSYQSLEQVLSNELLTRVDREYYLPETHEECLKDIRDGKALSMDCVKAVRERSIYNKLYMTILWKQKLPQVLETIARRADLYSKVFLFHHLDLTDETNEPNRILVSLNHIDKFTDEPVFDIKIQKPTETVEFQRVPTGGFQPFSSAYSLAESTVMEYTNNSYPATCVMMEKYVRTYDQRIYRFSADECNYVLSAHCAENKYFAITTKGLDNSKRTKEIRVYISDKTLILTPKSGSEWKVKFNGREYIIKEAELLDSTHEIYAYIDTTEDETNLHVVALRAGISLRYDGVNVKVQVDPRYKGELCGLCSEFDGEEMKEYVGLDRCLYTHPLDFANSAITNRHGRCEKQRLYGEKMCDDEGDSMASRRMPSSHDETTIKRNMVISRGSEYCFSVLPVPVCPDNAQPTETEPQEVAFHCLPKRDVTAKKLVMESKRRVLSELAYKSVDFQDTVEVAKMC